MKKFQSILFLIILLAVMPASAVSAGSVSTTDTVILSVAGDAYYALAEEIAAAEGIPIFHTLAEAAAADPVYMLWVVAPENLSQNVLMDFGLTLNELDTSISIGILSGSSLADARRLWKGSVQVPAAQNAIINGEKVGKIEGGIIYGADSRRKPVGLSKDNLIEVLETSSVVQVSMEGAVGSWFDQVNDIVVKAEDIPPLPSSVILHYGCSTFRPWAENSIAMACIDQGAIAYAGFVDPSITGKRFGDYSDIAFLYTWNEFPLGHLVQIQNRATMQHSAALPHYFLLGDPRIYARGEKPYRIIDDQVSGEQRVIHLAEVETGLIPVRIEDGAGYDFANVCGLDASSMDSSFFNNRLQMVDIRGDKYLFIDNTNGSQTLTIEMQRNAPFIWLVSGNLVDFLDTVVSEGQGSEMPLLLSIAVLVFMLFWVFKKRTSGRELFSGLAFGAVWAAVVVLYALLRKEQVSVTNIPVRLNVYYHACVFLLSASGFLLYRKADSMRGRMAAVLLANLNHLVTFLIFAVAVLAKLLLFGAALSINKATYPWAFALLELLVGCIFYSILYSLFNRFFTRSHVGEPYVKRR